MTPAVDHNGDISASELYIHDAVDERVHTRAGPERQRRGHVDTTVKTGLLVGQVGHGERQVGKNEGEKDGEDHVKRM